MKILHLVDGITQLGSRQSLSPYNVGGGVTNCDSIKRMEGGYLVGYAKKLYVVGDSAVACAEVEDDHTYDVAPAVEPLPAPKAEEPVAVDPPVVVADAPAPEPEPVLVPGSIAQDKQGRFYRVPFPKEEPQAEGAPPEPSPDEPARTMQRRGRRGHSMVAPPE